MVTHMGAKRLTFNDGFHAWAVGVRWHSDGLKVALPPYGYSSSFSIELNMRFIKAPIFP